MPIPDFDVDSFIVNYLPPDKRTPYWLGWMIGLGSALKRMNNIFTSFRKGSLDLGYWSSTYTYSIGNVIRTLNGCYESQTNGNLNNNPITDDGTNWLKILNDFIGATERASYTVQKLSLEYALNRKFQQALTDNGFLGFRNPNTINPGIGYLPLSDIYLNSIIPAYPSFICYTVETGSGVSYTNSSQGWVFTIEIYVFATTYQAQINIPLSVYNALGTTNPIRDSVIYNFVNKIARIGTLNYVIQTY